jgi:hypothetical protein
MSAEEQFWLALVAIVLALMTAAWAYGTYCYVQMVRHRRPGIPMLAMLWPAESLTERGREFRKGVLRSYAAFGVLALVLLILNEQLPG